MDEQEVDNSMETFMTLFNKMFSETKYNLQALNKRMESMDKCFNNVLLLSSDKPFDEVNEEENEQNNENINIDNLENKLKNTNNSNNLPKKKKQTGKMTSKELDEIEKMFKDIDDPTANFNTFFVGKKRNTKKNTSPAQGTDPKNYYKDIQELLKNYSLDNDNEIEDSKNKHKKEEIKENKKKGKRGRKKKNADNNKNALSSESNADIDYLVPEKNDGYTKFKEFKELKKKMNNKKYNKYSDEEDDDDLDSDF